MSMSTYRPGSVPSTGGSSDKLRVSLATLRIPPAGWSHEVDVPRNTTVADMKALLLTIPGAPRITARTKILNQSSAQMYTLNDEERVTKKMLVTDISQEASLGSTGTPGAYPNSPVKPSSAGPKSGPPRPKAGATPPSGFSKADEAQMAWRLILKVLPQFDEDLPHIGYEDSGLETVMTALKEQSTAIEKALKSKELYSTAKTSTFCFDGQVDMFKSHRHGDVCLNESLLTSAMAYYQVNQSIIARFGGGLTGLAKFNRALAAYKERMEVQTILVTNLLKMLLGLDYMNLPPEEAAAAQVLWLAPYAGMAPALGSFLTWLQHLALPPLRRRRRAIPRTIAWVDLLFHQIWQTLRSTATRRVAGATRVIWIFGASDRIEGRLAREGLFADAGALKDVDMRLCLFGDPKSLSNFSGKMGRVEVSTHTWEDVGKMGSGGPPRPLAILCFHTGVGSLQKPAVETWLPRIGMALRIPECALVSLCRCREEALCESELLEYLGGTSLLRQNEPTKYVRNLYSSQAGNPDVDVDECGWFISYTGTSKSSEDMEKITSDSDPAIVHVRSKLGLVVAADEEVVLAEGTTTTSADVDEAETPSEATASRSSTYTTPAAAAAATTKTATAPAAPMLAAPSARDRKRSSVVFWGILDLKYDPNAVPEERVKVLETGDGQSSKFSGYGAAIKQSFEKEHRLEETIRRAVLTENKKLTHDRIVESGYGHLRPRQAAFAKVYTEDLASRIATTMSLGDGDTCILKLCNRTRGAGVIPVVVSDLDATLEVLLNPPKDIEAWFLEQPEDWAIKVSSGCFEEQARHWWSNECPIFVVEDLCLSAPTSQGDRSFDGTMRVGFSLHREIRDRLPDGWLDTPDGPVFVGEDNLEYTEGGSSGSRAKAAPEIKSWGDERPYMDLFRAGDSALRVQWLGGYWKLPLEDTDSKDLRGKIVSVAKQGTAPVAEDELVDVYACLGEMVPLLFSSSGSTSLSHNSLSKRYNDLPEFASFVCSRLAASMRPKDKQKSQSILALARAALVKSKEGRPKAACLSYIERNCGVYEAMHLRWPKAEIAFRKSIEALPTNATSRFLIGTAQLEAGSLQVAITFLKQALLLDPDFKAPYVNLGVAYLRSCEYQKAAEASRAGLLRHPVTPQATYNLGLSTFALALADQEAGAEVSSSMLRAEALKHMEAAKESRAQGNLWNEDDQDILEILQASEPLRLPKKGPVRDGWRSLNWRP